MDSLRGALERPRNVAADRPGTIHDETTARGLGFAGGWVSARVHLNVFVPVLLEVFGPAWFERGSLSLDFRVATLDREEVRAVVDRPGASGAQVEARLERPDGETIAFGTAAVGAPAEPTYLATIDVGAHDEPPYELIAAVGPGDVFAPREITLETKAAERMIGGIPHPWYLDASSWGHPIASPSLMVNALGAACGTYLRTHPIHGVFIDGGTEIRNINGPVRLGCPYVVGGRILARGRSGRSTSGTRAGSTIPRACGSPRCCCSGAACQDAERKTDDTRVE